MKTATIDITRVNGKLHLLARYRNQVIREPGPGCTEIWLRTSFASCAPRTDAEEVIANWRPRLRALGFTHVRFSGDCDAMQR